MSTPAKKPVPKTAAKASTSSVAKKPPAKPAAAAKPPTKPAAKKPSAKPINLSDLDSIEDSEADQELERLLAGDSDIAEDPEDEDSEGPEVDPSDDFEDSSFDEGLDPLEEESTYEEKTSETDLTPTALIDRLSQDSTAAPAPVAKDEGAITLPPCVDTEDSTQNTSGVKVVIEAYATGCLNCTHLVPTADIEYTDCHFTAGNTFCPAQSVKIVFTGRRNVFVTKLKTARASGDSNRVLKILALLEKETIDFKDFVLSKAGII